MAGRRCRKTRRILRHAVEPGTLCERELPCEALQTKLWRLMVPAEAQRPRHTADIDFLARLETESTTATVAPGRYCCQPTSAGTEFAQHLARLHTGLGEMTRFCLLLTRLLLQRLP